MSIALNRFFKHFRQDVLSIIGMIHVLPLPGTPACNRPFNLQQLLDRACAEAEIYVKHGLHGVCLENMFDRPYVMPDGNESPEITAIMTRVCSEVRKLVPDRMPCGVQILAGQNQKAMAVAVASGLQFIRVEGFVFGHVADEGLMGQAQAGPLLRYRRLLDADEQIAVLCDVKKKHCSHAITNDVTLLETVKAAQFFLSDAIIITGRETGDAPSSDEVKLIRNNYNGPLIIGSGLNDNNLPLFKRMKIDGAIVGSTFKQNSNWQNEICEERIKRFMDRLNSIKD